MRQGSWQARSHGHLRTCSDAWVVPSSGERDLFRQRSPLCPPFAYIVRPLFAQANRRTSGMGPSLRLALQWWQEVLKLDIAQERAWRNERRARAVVLADARGWPARAAAIVLVDGEIHWTSFPVPAEILGFFQPRGDNQIGSLEILAIAVAMSTFPGDAFATAFLGVPARAMRSSQISCATAKWIYIPIIRVRRRPRARLPRSSLTTHHWSTPSGSVLLSSICHFG